MKIDIMTLFPEMCESVLSESIIGRARKAEIVDIRCHNIRDFAGNKHNRVDDAPYGGGMGMVMQAEPIYKCFENICEESGEKPHLIYMSPKGRTFRQPDAVRLSKYDHIVLLCGHYEGVDQRVIDEIVDEEISVGDYVLTGGELPAMVLIDSVSRYVEGVLSTDSTKEESFSQGYLEYSQYTRPEEFHGKKVPEILASGNHQKIDEWRRKSSLINTFLKRPELLNEKDLKEAEKIISEEHEN